MRKELLAQLSAITEEEQKIRDGSREIERSLYSGENYFVVEKERLLTEGRLIRIRTHTRFLAFPEHRHNYVEMVYQAAGETRHTVNGEPLTLSQGEILIMNQGALQSIEAAGEGDIAVNFLILPQFFDRTLAMIGNQAHPLRDFLVNCLSSGETPVSYLHFRVAGILPIENLMENLVASLLSSEERTATDEATMGLLFLHLLEHTDKLTLGEHSYEQALTMQLLKYIDDHYREGSLSDFARRTHSELTSLSRMIKKHTGFTYQEILQQKRMAKAAELLSGSRLSIADISSAVGYENISFFHRLFRRYYGMTPRAFRVRALTPSHPLQRQRLSGMPPAPPDFLSEPQSAPPQSSEDF